MDWRAEEMQEMYLRQKRSAGQFSKSLMNVFFYDKRQTFSNVTAFTYWRDKTFLKRNNGMQIINVK